MINSDHKIISYSLKDLIFKMTKVCQNKQEFKNFEFDANLENIIEITSFKFMLIKYWISCLFLYNLKIILNV